MSFIWSHGNSNEPQFKVLNFLLQYKPLNNPSVNPAHRDPADRLPKTLQDNVGRTARVHRNLAAFSRQYNLGRNRHEVHEPAHVHSPAQALHRGDLPNRRVVQP